jgi:catechol 2,3-dioxygenase-like lactoylglutathione lyase family enzyme
LVSKGLDGGTRDDEHSRAFPLLERYSFVAMTTDDLQRARAFWVDLLRCPIIEEHLGEYFIVDAAGLKLCVDVETGNSAVPHGDPVVAFAVTSVARVVSALRERGVAIVREADATDKARWAEIRDPDGHTILLTEPD